MSQNSSTSIPHLILLTLCVFSQQFLGVFSANSRKKRFCFLVEYYKHILQSVCVFGWMERQKKIHNTLCISHNIWLELTTTTTTNRDEKQKSRGGKNIRLKIRFWRLEFVCFGFIGFSSMFFVCFFCFFVLLFFFLVLSSSSSFTSSLIKHKNNTPVLISYIKEMYRT